MDEYKVLLPGVSKVREKERLNPFPVYMLRDSASPGMDSVRVLNILGSFNGMDPGGILHITRSIARNYLFSPAYEKLAKEVYDQALREAAVFVGEDSPVDHHYRSFLLSLRTRVESFIVHYKNLISPRFRNSLLKEGFHMSASLRTKLKRKGSGPCLQ